MALHPSERGSLFTRPKRAKIKASSSPSLFSSFFRALTGQFVIYVGPSRREPSSSSFFGSPRAIKLANEPERVLFWRLKQPERRAPVKRRRAAAQDQLETFGQRLYGASPASSAALLASFGSFVRSLAGERGDSRVFCFGGHVTAADRHKR